MSLESARAAPAGEGKEGGGVVSQPRSSPRRAAAGALSARRTHALLDGDLLLVGVLHLQHDQRVPVLVDLTSAPGRTVFRLSLPLAPRETI